MVREEKIDSQFCIRVWSYEKDILPAFLSTVLALVVISTTLMFALYFRVVYILWFRQNNDAKLSHQKRVCVLNLFNIVLIYLFTCLTHSLSLVRLMKRSTFGPDLSELSS